MSLISTYGVGAGRAIAGELDEDEERLRQRRTAAAQRTEQEKRGAAVRDRLARAQAAEAAVSNQRLHQHLQSEMDSRDTQVVMQRKLPAPPAPQRPAASDEHAPPRVANPVRRQDKQENIPSSVICPDDRWEKSIPTAPADREDEFFQGEAEESQANPMVFLSTAEFDKGIPPVHRINDLIDDVMALRGNQFAEQLVTHLEDIMLSIRQQPEMPTDSTEVQSALAALDFIEGYVEAASAGMVDSQKTMSLISDLRQQLLGSGTPSNAPAVIASAVVASQITADKGRAANVSEVRSNGRQRLSVRDRNSAANPDDEADAALLAEGAGLILQVPAGAVKPSKSNLSKDSEKRRDETLVSVTVRSV